MMDVKKLVTALEDLAINAELYYKWANQFDLRIEDIKLRSSIARAKDTVKEYKAGLVE